MNALSASRVVFVLDGYAFIRSGSCYNKFAMFWRSRAGVMVDISVTVVGNGSDVGVAVDQIMF